jgi:hypothetical protein
MNDSTDITWAKPVSLTAHERGLIMRVLTAALESGDIYGSADTDEGLRTSIVRLTSSKRN